MELQTLTVTFDALARVDNSADSKVVWVREVWAVTAWEEVWVAAT